MEATYIITADWECDLYHDTHVVNDGGLKNILPQLCSIALGNIHPNHGCSKLFFHPDHVLTDAGNFEIHVCKLEG